MKLLSWVTTRRKAIASQTRTLYSLTIHFWNEKRYLIKRIFLFLHWMRWNHCCFGRFDVTVEQCCGACDPSGRAGGQRQSWCAGTALCRSDEDGRGHAKATTAQPSELPHGRVCC